MALTKVTSASVKDNELVNADLHTAANIDGSKLADDSISLAKLEHGTSSNNGKFLQANNGADPSFETVNTDLVSDTTPQLGGQLDTNGNHIKLLNGNKLLMGTNSSYEIYNDSSNLIIDQNTDGQVTYIRGKQNGTIQFDASDTGNHVAAKFKFSNDNIPVSSVELYHGGAKKAETVTGGFTVTGTLTATAYAGDGSALTGVSSPEVYGFNTDSNGNLIVTTTNGGADNISGTAYAAFEDVIYAATGFTFSVNTDGKLIATI